MIFYISAALLRKANSMSMGQAFLMQQNNWQMWNTHKMYLQLIMDFLEK